MATQEYANDELSRRGPDEKGPKALSTSFSSLHSAPSSSAPGNNVDRIPTFSIPEGFDSAPSHHHRPAGVPPDIEGVIDGIEATSLQQRRLSLFDYQPFSLPPSRVPSRESPSPSRNPGRPDLRTDSSDKPMHSPPLTPASTHDKSGFRHTRSEEARGSGQQILDPTKLAPGDPSIMTPQTSPPRSSSATTSSVTRQPVGQRPHSSSGASQQPSYFVGYPGSSSSEQPTFIIGGKGSSKAPSEDSPSGTPSGSGSQTPTRIPPSRPFTPAGEHDDPYARSRRPVQTKKKPEEIEPRFIFGKSSRGSSTNLLGLGGESSGLKPEKKHHSHFSLHSLGKHHSNDSNSTLGSGQKQGSMGELKRFFKSSQKRSRSPGASSIKSSKSSTSTAAPFADDHGLNKKYGRFGKVLGSGAGGSVRLMKRSSDGVTFAVKEFRPRHNYESEREYAKKVTAEFCIGSTLHHGNIIETLDIVHEKGKWYEVMEYCPYDLFATVMTGKMSREEVACCFMQILSGVTYLHHMGLAHRDLKLDNVVMNEYGILKIIDFGSASVFRYPFENDIVEACGIVGSDPYLAPEVCNEIKYDPQPADIWSLAIIFCCMTLRRFPWKAPRQSDNSFKLFSSPSDPPQNTQSSSPPLPTSKSHQNRTAAVAQAGNNNKEVEGTTNNPAPSTVQGSGQQIKGPYRLLRLLPRESRYIIGRMLDLDPKRRATLEEIWYDGWIGNLQYCTQEVGGTVCKAPGHTHTLEGTSGGSNVSTTKSTK
ncbi:uncharacterized protein LAJ45_05273 [Morchella importuna]|uniref:non-specific serine/threonine protein kinase n=1 Tax=Morchella conica CCBAS932 TaxID=1392247 RepID=A0A3N4KZ78_9PEZI|nr:uncharacterized protein LAJ45_05273 [Morchella importuna]KAH8150577.1 hypothetical protein LAJ45_05273 [Morchella importuna]RPB14562.1 Pkinase-domain-containing protein [Morchella conica CCBAS932]